MHWTGKISLALSTAVTLFGLAGAPTAEAQQKKPNIVFIPTDNLKMAPRDYLAEKRTSAAGQYPAAVILGCVDSRVPAEIAFDAGIGDTFNGRVAGNVVNDDLLGKPTKLLTSRWLLRSPARVSEDLTIVSTHPGTLSWLGFDPYSQTDRFSRGSSVGSTD
jgi:hypothetical protein